MTTTPRVSRADRFESVALVLIAVAVAAVSGAASFRHVHDWTMHNSPAGTGDWFGWANAAVSELIPLAAGLEIRRRHRLGLPVGRYPVALIVGAVILSLTGQFAEARHSVSGWIISAVPAVGFMALVKLALSRPSASAMPSAGSAADDAPASVPAAPVSVRVDTDQPESRPAERSRAELGEVVPLGVLAPDRDTGPTLPARINGHGIGAGVVR